MTSSSSNNDVLLRTLREQNFTKGKSGSFWVNGLDKDSEHIADALQAECGHVTPRFAPASVAQAVLSGELQLNDFWLSFRDSDVTDTRTLRFQYSKNGKLSLTDAEGILPAIPHTGKDVEKFSQFPVYGLRIKKGVTPLMIRANGAFLALGVDFTAQDGMLTFLQNPISLFPSQKIEIISGIVRIPSIFSYMVGIPFHARYNNLMMRYVRCEELSERILTAVLAIFAGFEVATDDLTVLYAEKRAESGYFYATTAGVYEITYEHTPYKAGDVLSRYEIFGNKVKVVKNDVLGGFLTDFDAVLPEKGCKSGSTPGILAGERREPDGDEDIIAKAYRFGHGPWSKWVENALKNAEFPSDLTEIQLKNGIIYAPESMETAYSTQLGSLGVSHFLRDTSLYVFHFYDLTVQGYNRLQIFLHRWAPLHIKLAFARPENLLESDQHDPYTTND